MGDPAITQNDLESVANIYDSIRLVYKQKNPHIDSSLHEAFERHIKLVMTELSQKVTDQPKLIVEVLVLMTKFKLFQLCSTKITSFIKLLNPDACSILTEIFAKQEQMYAELAQRLILAAKRVEELEIEDKRLEMELQSSKKETEEVLSAAETLEKTVVSLQLERDNLKVQLEGLQIDLTQQLESVQEENKSLSERLERSSKVGRTEGRVMTPKRERREGKSPLRLPLPMSPHPTPKELSLRQLKDFIEELYTSKPKFDQKFLEAKQPRETLEQHMMSVLNQKYGLKSLIAEWVTNVVKGIQRYAYEDNDVATFGKILRNEVEEEFRFVQKQVKNSVSELLRLRIKADFPYIQEKAAKDLLVEKMNGELESEEWKYVVAYMYNETDRSHLENVLQGLIRAKESQTPKR